ncbi:hypothetical protein DV735_g4626, partial [Chaetothyriales sp. CBS 134920]
MEAQRLTRRRSVIESFKKTIWRQFIDGSHDSIELKDLQKSPLVTIHPISFTTGEPPKDIEKFFKPIPASQIHQWLTQYKPWDVESDFVREENPWILEYGPLTLRPQTEAQFVSNLISIYLKASHESDALPIIPCHTNWRTVGCDEGGLRVNALAKANANWQIAKILTYCLKTNSREQEDWTKPHIIAFPTARRRQITKMPPKGSSTAINPVRLQSVKKLKVQRPDRTNVNPCTGPMSAVLSE